MFASIGVRYTGDLPHSACSSRLWLPADDILGALLSNHREAIGCTGEAPNNASATRSTLIILGCAGLVSGSVSSGVQRRALRIAASTASALIAFAFVVDAAVDAPPGPAALAAAGLALATWLGLRRPPLPAPK